jgi:hypothetical protein
MSREPTRQSSFHCRKARGEDGGKAGVGIELATVLAGTGRPGNFACGDAGRTGDCASGAFCGVRFLWSLTFGWVATG